MTTNSQLTTEPKKKQNQKQSKQTTRTGRESQKWRSHGGLSVGSVRGENGGKGTCLLYTSDAADELMRV